ncbi:hypothetical protein GCM10027098_07290 [Bowmanella dokdonensis]
MQQAEPGIIHPALVAPVACIDQQQAKDDKQNPGHMDTQQKVGGQSIDQLRIQPGLA